jgi:lipid-binding SYLF domain-containing protein
MKRYALAGLVLAIAVVPAHALPPSNSVTLDHAIVVLDELADIPLKGIPPKLLADAQGVAIIPHVVKAGFVLGGRGGHGVVFAREKDGNWGEPVFINLGGASVGFQAGIESTDVVLVFRNRRSLDNLLDGKTKLTLGADAAVAAGPVGRMAAAATDAKLEAEILSYSRSRGLFAGVSLDGAVIYADAKSNAMFRRSIDDKKAAAMLKSKLAEMCKDKPVILIPPVIDPPVVVPGKPR